MSEHFPIPGADWRPVPVAAARRDLGVDTTELESLDLAGGLERDALVHHGDLSADGPLALRARGHRLFVVAGDLLVDGPLCLESYDSYSVLYVTGSVRAKNLVCCADAQLFVAGSLDAGELLTTCLSDAAVLIVQGVVTAGTWIEAGGRGEISLSAAPGTRLLDGAPGPGANPYPAEQDGEPGPAADAVLPGFTEPDGSLDIDAVRDAVLAGRPVLRAGR
ncbi:hypothetical protein ACWDR0_32610 [Streptomyces sp. NPDC003691]